MANPITDAINKAIGQSGTGSDKPAPTATPVASSTLKTTSKSGNK